MEIDVLRELDERIQASINRIQQLQRENARIGEAPGGKRAAIQ